MNFGRNTGLLLIIVEMTNGKCLLSLEVAAPSQITRQTSLAAMIMSTPWPANKNATVNDAYTSPRAARKITLSRNPLTASRPTTVQICHIGSTPTVVPNAGRDVALIVPSFFAPGDTEDERKPWWEMARMQVAFYGSTPNYAFIFEQLGREGTTERIREKQKAGDLAGMAATVDDDLLSHFCVAAPWDERRPAAFS